MGRPSMSMPYSAWHAGHAWALWAAESGSFWGSSAPIHTRRTQPSCMASLLTMLASVHPQQGNVICSPPAPLMDASSQ